MGLGRTHPKPNQIVASGVGALVLDQFAVPKGHATGVPNRLEMSVASPHRTDEPQVGDGQASRLGIQP